MNGKFVSNVVEREKRKMDFTSRTRSVEPGKAKSALFLQWVLGSPALSKIESDSSSEVTKQRQIEMLSSRKPGERKWSAQINAHVPHPRKLEKQLMGRGSRECIPLWKFQRIKG